jgi:hypothetical protein
MSIYRRQLFRHSTNGFRMQLREELVLTTILLPVRHLGMMDICILVRMVVQRLSPCIASRKFKKLDFLRSHCKTKGMMAILFYFVDRGVGIVGLHTLDLLVQEVSCFL